MTVTVFAFDNHSQKVKMAVRHQASPCGGIPWQFKACSWKLCPTHEAGRILDPKHLRAQAGQAWFGDLDSDVNGQSVFTLICRATRKVNRCFGRSNLCTTWLSKDVRRWFRILPSFWLQPRSIRRLTLPDSKYGRSWHCSCECNTDIESSSTALELIALRDK